MKLEALNTSIVIVAESHNPTILHHSFLLAQQIVPSDWKVEQPQITTPAFALVKYTNEIVFTADTNRFTVLDSSPEIFSSTAHSPIPEAAKKYVASLPHVHYRDIGINFAGFVEMKNPEEWLIHRFLNRGPGNDDKLCPSSLDVKLVYPVDRGALTLNCQIGTVKKVGATNEIACLIISGNYGVHVLQSNSSSETQSAIELYSHRLAHFMEITRLIFGLEA